jgi:hypothetical protein
MSIDKDEFMKALEQEHNVDDYKCEYTNNPYGELADLIEEYASVLEVQDCPCCIRDTLLEFAVELMQNFRITRVEED